MSKKLDLSKAVNDVNFTKDKKNETLKTTWRDRLVCNNQGMPKARYDNHVLLFENSEEFKGSTLRYNMFTRRIEFNGEPLKTSTRSIIRNKFERCGEFRNPQVTDDFLNEYSFNNRYNPVIDYLESIRDKRRDDIKCKDIFVKWFKAKDTQHKIVERMSEKWCVSAIKRIYEPGCEIEGMIYVFGKTGTGKSTFIERLAQGFSHKYVGDLENTQRICEVMNHSWIVNFDEMKSLMKKDPDVVKDFLTTTIDTVRLAYRMDAEAYDRHCVFFGSTNNPDILKDYSGDIERRFWPIISLLVDKKYIWDNFNSDIVDAIWADALYIYEHNKDYNITISDFNEEEEKEMKELQKKCKTYYNDDCVDLINEILNRKYKLNINGEFNSLEDFKKQINEPILNSTGEINYIPISYLNVVLQVFYRVSRKNNWIAAALSDDWVFKKKFTRNAGNCMCLIRKSYYRDHGGDIVEMI